jgi:hypothetical protein
MNPWMHDLAGSGPVCFAPLWNWHGPAQPSPSQLHTCSAADCPGRTPQSQPRRRGCGGVEGEEDDHPEMRTETAAPSTRRRRGTLGSIPTISPRTQDLSLPFRSVLCCVDINCNQSRTVEEEPFIWLPLVRDYRSNLYARASLGDNLSSATDVVCIHVGSNPPFGLVSISELYL